MELSEERKARNEAIFRDAGCREVVCLRRDEYEAVRANPAGFILASGHPSDSGRLLAEHEDYVVVEKDVVAREIAVDTDPRGEDG